jgi:hypothetical protein
MTRDQLRLVLQPDDQLVKIKTVTAIDDHSDGEDPGVEQDLQSRQVYFRTHPLRPQPHSSSALAALLVRRIGALMLTRLLNSGRIMNRLFIAVLTTLLVALAGCSGDSASGPTTIPSSEPPAAAAPATVGPSTSPIPAVPVNECLSGRYRLVRFAGVGERGSYGTGEGGDVTVTFNNGSYLLSGEGKEPITLSLPGPTAGLLVDGTISGNYQVQGERATFTVSESSGTATLTFGRLKKSLPMSQFGDVLASDAAAGVVCANNELTVTLQYIRLEFSKL